MLEMRAGSNNGGNMMSDRGASETGHRGGRAENLFRFNIAGVRGKEPVIHWDHDGEVKSYMTARPRGPWRHPDGVHSPQGTGYPQGWRPPAIVLMSPLRNIVPGQPLPLPDVWDGGGVYDWIVSDRAKRLFETIDGEAFAFCRNEVRIGPQMKPYDGPPVWRCDVVRSLDALDYDRTPCRSETFPGGGTWKTPLIGVTRYFRRSIVSGHHIFRLAYRPDSVNCDAIFRTRVRELGLTIGVNWISGQVIDG